MGIALSGVAFLVAAAYLALKIGGLSFPVGNPTVVIVVAFFSGIQLLSLGVIGEYVGRIYDESRRRPKYILESRHGWDEARRGWNGEEEESASRRRWDQPGYRGDGDAPRESRLESRRAWDGEAAR